MKQNSLMKWVAFVFKKIHLYHRLKYSVFYQYYLKKKNPLIIINEKSELSFLSKLIPSNQLVFDVGANTGEYTSLYLKLGSKVISVEPDKTNIKILKIRFQGNPNVKIIDKAISNKSGVQELFINGEGSGFNTMSEKWKASLQDPSVNRWNESIDFKESYQIETITLDEVISKYGIPFFIKIDVEGYEYHVISSLNRKIPLLNLEANLPEFLDETILCIQHLVKIDNTYKFNVCDRHSFVFTDWKSGNDFTDYVKNTDRRYLDIWATIV